MRHESESFKVSLPGLSRQCRHIAGHYEFDTFLVGCRLGRLRELGISDSAADEVGRYFKVHVGLYLDRLWPDREIDFKRPDLRFQIDPVAATVGLLIAPRFYIGRYRKLVRGIPQSHWPCRECKGQGCDHCDHTGRRYQESVEEYITGPMLAATGGSRAKLHCMGREDIDARMLGEGRPFVVELLEPVRRHLALDDLERRIGDAAAGRVEVRGLELARREDVARIKASRARKTYRARVQVGGPLPADAAERLSRLAGSLVSQRTPTRVAHRRADLVRERRVLAISLDPHENGTLSLTVEGAAGLYIKELISGDDGRTSPSVSAILGVDCHCVELDVLSVHADDGLARDDCPA